MPAFGAVKGFGDLRDDQALTQEELHLISDWVEGGTPEGDPALLPKNPEFGPAPGAALKTGGELVVDGNLTLKQAMTIAGARPKGLGDCSSGRRVSARP